MFTSPGACSIPGCEVSLLFEDRSRLYVCKHQLADVSQFFKGMFYGDFEENHKNEVKLHEIARDDMLLFLECTAKKMKAQLDPIPSCSSRLCALIKLSDQLMCDFLKVRIIRSLNNPRTRVWESNWNNTGLILQTAFQHAVGCPLILDHCINHISLCPKTIPIVLALAAEYNNQRLKERLDQYMKGEKWHTEMSDEQKVDLLVVAHQYRLQYPKPFPLCVKLCATLPAADLNHLHTKVSAGVMAAVLALRVQIDNDKHGERKVEFEETNKFEVNMMLIDSD